MPSFQIRTGAYLTIVLGKRRMELIITESPYEKFLITDWFPAAFSTAVELEADMRSCDIRITKVINTKMPNEHCSNFKMKGIELF